MAFKPTIKDIFDVKFETDFENIALKVFKYQAQNCKIYNQFLAHLNIDVSAINTIEQIPFLPIDFFKSHLIISESLNPEIVFKSSGTTSSAQSQHYVSDLKIYEESYFKAFTAFYGNIQNTCILALLPNYLEREGSSLIYMVNDLISKSEHKNSGFFLYNTQQMFDILQLLKFQKQKTILIGVTYALLDFVEKYHLDFPDLIVMETGGMKGKRKEIIRETLHQILQNGFGVANIHSEYGMTELLSQAYSSKNGLFISPNWMQVYIRDTNDPLTLLADGKTGGINVIDLANLNSCSFIATQDLGKKHPDNFFEVLGRFDNSDIRGCNLLVS